ncbi:MAG: hypothetical protein U9P38_05575 [Campylobacterota bacterium]|nr:hypothetical protein [Campylobacterota bacterium]
MSTKLGLHIGGRRFDVNVDDDFAPHLQEELKKDFNIDGNNELQLVLRSYIRKTHEIFLMEKDMNKLLRKLNKAAMT